MRKLSTPLEWSSEDLETLRFAPALNCTDEFVKDFAVFGLAQALQDFGVGSYEGARVCEWYWKASRSWPHKQSQAEFNKYARARISDRVGYTRRRSDAFHVVDSLFDKARFSGVNLNEVIDAVVFLSPTKPLPPDSVVENGDIALVDLTRRNDSPKVLKIDFEFLDTLKRLYPFEREDDAVVKSIPIGETAAREFSLVKLVWWSQNSDTTYDEMNKAIGFKNGDRLDWRRENLFSKWRAAAVAHEARVPEEFAEFQDAHGNTTIVEGQYVGMSEGLSQGLSLIEGRPAKSTPTAKVLNWLREKAVR